jgi:putative N6-adenine-specific DNA methylase
MSESSFSIYCGCAPGLEHLLLAEIQTIAGQGVRLRSRAGGVELRAGAQLVVELHTHLRLAEFIRVVLGSRRGITSFPLMERAFGTFAWHAWCRPGDSVQLKVTTARSRLMHTGAIEERFARWLDSAGIHVRPEQTLHALHIRMEDDVLTVSADTRALPLYQRGERGRLVSGGMRETLAAAMSACALPPDVDVVVDPFAGGGTVLLESTWWPASMDAAADSGAPVSAETSPSGPESWQVWPAFAGVSGPLTQRLRSSRTLVGADIDPVAMDACRINLEHLRSGIAAGARSEAGRGAPDRSATVHLHTGDFEGLDLRPWSDGRLWMASNLPYGHRVRPADLEQTFRRLGRWIQRGPLEGVIVVNGHRAFAEASGLIWDRRLTFRNRGLPVECLVWRRAAAS